MFRPALLIILLLPFCTAFPQSYTVNCNGYTIQFTNTSKCLINEYTIFVNQMWLSCAQDTDGFMSQSMFIVQTLCNSNSAVFLTNYPDQQIKCGVHSISLNPTCLCLKNELGVFIDGISFLCVVNDDSYSTSVMKIVGAMCNTGSNNIALTALFP